MAWYDIFGAIFSRRPAAPPKRARETRQTLQQMQENPKGTDYRERGLQTQVTPWILPYDRFRQRWDRKRLVEEVNRYVRTDPRLSRANQKMAQAAIHKGITVTVQGAQGRSRSARLAREAQAIINQVLRTTRLNAKLVSWTRLLIREGELDLNVIVDHQQRRIVGINRLPHITIQRNEDENGQFPDLERAFTQVDPLTQLPIKDPVSGEERHFPLYALNSIRYQFDDGELYGVSLYAATLKHVQLLQDLEEQMFIRRMVRAGLKLLFKILRADGQPSDWEEVRQFKENNKQLEDPESLKTAVLQNIYANSQVQVDPIQGDAKLDEIKDVEFIQQNLWVGATVPKGLTGYGESINRDVLKEQQEEFNRDLDHLNFLLEHGDGGPYSGMRAILDFALAIQGINPDTVSYSIQWTEHTTETKADRIDYVKTLRDLSLVPRRFALHLLSNDLGLENEEAIDALLAELEEEEESSTPPPPDEEPGTDGLAAGDSLKDDLADLAGRMGRRLRDRGRRVWRRVQEHPELHPLLEGLVRHGQIQQRLGLPVAGGSRPVTQDSAAAWSCCGDHPGDATGEDEDDQPGTSPYLLALIAGTLDREDYSRLRPIYLAAARRGAREASVQLGVGYRSLPAEVAYAIRLAIQDRWAGIDETTLGHLRREIAHAFRTGAEYEAWERAVREVLQHPDWRRQQVSETEVAWAYHQGALAAYQRGGVKHLVRNELPTACPACADKAGTWYTLEEAASVLPAHPS